MTRVTCNVTGELDGGFLVSEFEAAGYSVDQQANGVYDMTYYLDGTLVINTDATQEQGQAIVDAHDPVFFQASRDGDIVTVTIFKPNNVDNATELTPTFDGAPAETAQPLTNNEATFTVESADAVTIGINEGYSHQEVTI